MQGIQSCTMFFLQQKSPSWLRVCERSTARRKQCVGPPTPTPLFVRCAQVLQGRDNSMARAVAQGGLDEGAPLITALAHDLEVLQVSNGNEGIHLGGKECWSWMRSHIGYR